MKGKGATDKGLFDNEPTILLAGNPEGYVYRRKYVGQSTHNANGLMGGRPETVILRYFKKNHRVQ
jgi:hypothetical protein